MNERSTITPTPPVAWETTLERQERERLETKAVQELTRSQDLDRQNARHNVAAAQINRQQWHRESLEGDELDAKKRGEELEAFLARLRIEANDLRYIIGNESDLKAIDDEIESVRGRIIGSPLLNAHGNDIARLAGLLALRSCWPERKAKLQERLAQVEPAIKSAEAELQATKSLFTKAGEALAKLLPKAD